MKKVRLGFVGVGNMGQAAHLRNYASLDDCDVVAIAEVRPLLAQRVAARYGVANVYPSAEVMLEREQLDGLVAPQPFDRHGQLVAPLYRYGLPILTEKPLAHSIEVGESMLAQLEQGGSFHMVGYHKRSDPATAWAKTEIERLQSTLEMGALRYVRITMPPGDWIAGGFHEVLGSDERMPPLERDAAPSDMDESTFAAYVSFVNYYIHQVNLLRHLLGESYRVTHADPSGVLLVVQSQSGVCGTLEMAAYQTPLEWHETALVAFERGFIKLELPAPLTHNWAGRVEAFYGGQEARTIVPVLPPIDAMRAQAMNFVRAIRGEIKPPCEAPEALEDLCVARDYIRLWKGV